MPTNGEEASMRKFAVVGLTAISLLTLPVAQGMALPIAPSSTVALPSDNMVVQAKHGGGGNRIIRRNRGGGNWNGGNWGRHGGNWGRHGGHGGHGGHGHGGWDDDWWWPGVAGVGIGLGLGLLNNAPYYYNQPVYRVAPGVNSAHTVWCERRYRSYQAWNNTFQPYNGPRRECVSPYM
jgi:hypothetical protein